MYDIPCPPVFATFHRSGGEAREEVSVSAVWVGRLHCRWEGCAEPVLERDGTNDDVRDVVVLVQDAQCFVQGREVGHAGVREDSAEEGQRESGVGSERTHSTSNQLGVMIVEYCKVSRYMGIQSGET